MAAQHKYASAHVRITTAVSASRATEIVKVVGEATKGDMMIGMNAVHVDAVSPQRVNLAVRGLGLKIEMIRFHVDISTSGTQTLLTTRIDWYRTTQQKPFYLIPLGPKHMSGYKTYRRFMDNLGTAVAAEDPSATSEVREIAAR